MLGKLESFRAQAIDAARDLTAQAAKEVQEAVKEGKALARAAAKARQKDDSAVGDLDIDGFSLETADAKFDTTSSIPDIHNSKKATSELLTKLKDNTTDNDDDADTNNNNTTTTAAQNNTHTPIDNDNNSKIIASLESHLVLLEERVKQLETEKESSLSELRDARIEIEIILDERDKLSKSLKKTENDLKEAQKLAKERKNAMETAEARAAELAVSTAKQQEETGNLWQAKASSLASELELAKESIQKAENEAAIALKDKLLAEKQRAEALERERIAIEDARMARAEKDSLEAQTTQVHGEAEQIREENERRSKAFLAAVDAAVGKFRSDLEEERDAIQVKYVESQQAQHELKSRIDVLGKELLQVRKDADEKAAELLKQKELCSEYELAVQSLRQQAENSSQAHKETTKQLKEMEIRLNEERASFLLEKKELEEHVSQGEERILALRDDLAALKKEGKKWQQYAGERSVAQAAVAAAEESSRLAKEELTAAQTEIRRLQRELDELQHAKNNDTTTTPILSQKSTTQQQQLVKRESNFDLESALRQTPLLSSSSTTANTNNINTSSMTARGRQISSRWQLLIGYIALLHVIILVTMGRSAHECGHHITHTAGELP